MTFDIKSPILGFEHIHNVELEKIDDFFAKLVLTSQEISFTLINPFAIRDYDFEIPEYFKSLLNVTSHSNILVFNIMIVTTPMEKSTINFIAPLVFNVDNQTMAQVLLDNSLYPSFALVENISKYLYIENKKIERL